MGTAPASSRRLGVEALVSGSTDFCQGYRKTGRKTKHNTNLQRKTVLFSPMPPIYSYAVHSQHSQYVLVI